MSENKGFVNGDSPSDSSTSDQSRVNQTPAAVHAKSNKADVNIFCVTQPNDAENPNNEAKSDVLKKSLDKTNELCDAEATIGEANLSSVPTSVTVYYDNTAFEHSNDSNSTEKKCNLPSKRNSLSKAIGEDLVVTEKNKAPHHIFVTSGTSDHNNDNIRNPLSETHDQEQVDQSRSVTTCALSDIDIHRLAATPTPCNKNNQPTESGKSSTKDSNISAPIPPVTTVVDETSSSGVVCMNAAGPSNSRGDESLTQDGQASDKPSTSKTGPIRMDSTISRTSSLFSEGRGCRICWNNEEKEPFIQPCLCSGSSANVHVSCLKKWLQVTNQFKCEVCNSEYKSSSTFKPFKKWSWNCMKTRYLSQLEATMILMGILTPPLICGIVLCSQKIAEYIRYPEHAWKTAGYFAALLTLVIASSLTYLIALIYFCRKFGAVCRQWLQTNQRTVVSLGEVDTVIERVPQTSQERAEQILAEEEMVTEPIWTMS